MRRDAQGEFPGFRTAPGDKVLYVPAPRLCSPSGELLLPERVRLISLNQPYAGLVIAGVKTLETRTWPWPYEASWLAIYATRTLDTPACRRLGAVAEPHRERRGVVLGLVWIGGSRAMTPEDAGAACFPFGPGRIVWLCDAPHPFARPIPRDRGPQKFDSIPRAEVLAALDAPTPIRGEMP